MFCRVQLAQSIRLLDRPEQLDALIDELIALEFDKTSMLKMLPKLAGVLAELDTGRMAQEAVLFYLRKQFNN